jgi:hypothetical protein
MALQYWSGWRNPKVGETLRIDAAGGLRIPFFLYVRKPAIVSEPLSSQFVIQ